MARDLFERHAVIRLLVYAAAIIAVLYAVGMVWGVVAHYENVILLLFLAWIIVFVLQPILLRLERFGAPRLLAVAIIYLALIGLAVGSILLALPTIRTQAMHITTLFTNLFSAANISALDKGISGFLQNFGVSPSDAQALVNQIGKQLETTAGSLTNQLVAAAESMFGQAVSLFINTTVIIILSFYMMLDGAAMVERLVKRLPPAWIPDIRLFQRHVNTIFGGFLRAALVISLAYAALNWVVLAALGHPGAVLFAALGGLLLVVPWIGGVLAIIPSAALVLLESPPSAVMRNLVILIIALIVAQQVTMQIIAPRMLSAHMGLHPLLVFAALLIGAREAGVWGVLFGPPVAAIVIAMLDTFFERWQRTSGKYPDLVASPQRDQATGSGKTALASAEPAEDRQLVESPS